MLRRAGLASCLSPAPTGLGRCQAGLAGPALGLGDRHWVLWCPCPCCACRRRGDAHGAWGWDFPSSWAVLVLTWLSAASERTSAAPCFHAWGRQAGTRLLYGGCCPAAAGSAARLPCRRTWLREGSGVPGDANLPSGMSPRWAGGFAGGTLQGEAGGSARGVEGLSCKFGGYTKEIRLCEKPLLSKELGILLLSREAAVGRGVLYQGPLAGYFGGY